MVRGGTAQDLAQDMGLRRDLVNKGMNLWFP
jgi:hypothetical protein